MNDDALLAEQRALWSSRPRDWAEIAEPLNDRLFTRVLDVSEVAEGTRLLDVACGSGYAAALAAARGAVVSGIDLSPALLDIARERTPDADLREAEMDHLPFADAQFDVVTAVNALQFATDPDRALAEIARVLAPGGRLSAAGFAEPERNEGTALHLAMQGLVTEPGPTRHAPYLLSSASALRDAVERAGLRVVDSGEVLVPWRYADTGTAVRALLASAGGARAVRSAGEARTRQVLTEALVPFQDPTGTVTIRNLFRFLVGVTS